MSSQTSPAKRPLEEGEESDAKRQCTVTAPVNEIALLTLLTNDQQQTLNFYTNTLGFEKHTDATFGESRWLTLKACEREVVTIVKADTDDKKAVVGKQGGGCAFIVAHVDDASAAWERMKDKATVKQELKEESWGGKGFVILDDNGNAVYVLQANPARETKSGGADVVHDIAHITLQVDDPDATVAFYGDKLGMVKKMDLSYPGGRWLTIGTEEREYISVSKAESDEQKGVVGKQVGSHVFFVAHVEDIDAAWLRLKDDVEVTMPLKDEFWGKGFCMKDNSGNVLYVMQPKPHSSEQCATE